MGAGDGDNLREGSGDGTTRGTRSRLLILARRRVCPLQPLLQHAPHPTPPQMPERSLQWRQTLHYREGERRSLVAQTTLNPTNHAGVCFLSTLPFTIPIRSVDSMSRAGAASSADCATPSRARCFTPRSLSANSPHGNVITLL